MYLLDIDVHDVNEIEYVLMIFAAFRNCQMNFSVASILESRIFLVLLCFSSHVV